MMICAEKRPNTGIHSLPVKAGVCPVAHNAALAVGEEKEDGNGKEAGEGNRAPNTADEG